AFSRGFRLSLRGRRLNSVEDSTFTTSKPAPPSVRPTNSSARSSSPAFTATLTKAFSGSPSGAVPDTSMKRIQTVSLVVARSRPTHFNSAAQSYLLVLWAHDVWRRRGGSAAEAAQCREDAHLKESTGPSDRSPA